ncbi:MAG TPA: tRNA pseudouridine(13) synthase TruD, partial [Luteimonas sp.]|nr:tRNA pseudouridine(13) synthase TruD [Luteimonas sp.]
WTADGSLRLEFALPPGAYATSVLFELGTVEDAGTVNPAAE